MEWALLRSAGIGLGVFLGPTHSAGTWYGTSYARPGVYAPKVPLKKIDVLLVPGSGVMNGTVRTHVFSLASVPQGEGKGVGYSLRVLGAFLEEGDT